MPLQPATPLRTRRLSLAPPGAADEAAFLAAARASRGLHGPWVRAPVTAQRFQQLLAQEAPPGHRTLLLKRRADGALVGCIQLSQVVMGAFCSGYLGYYAFAGQERQGLMTEGLRAVVRHAFTHWGLHRLEANIQPGNTASIALARACGFAREGYSPRYLRIGGRWRDHERWARVKP